MPKQNPVQTIRKNPNRIIMMFLERRGSQMTTNSIVCFLILLWHISSASARAKVLDAATTSTSNGRGFTNEQERISPFQRIYGKENAAVRAEIHKIETESTHYRRTGLHADPDFFRLDDNGNTRRWLVILTNMILDRQPVRLISVWIKLI